MLTEVMRSVTRQQHEIGHLIPHVGHIDPLTAFPEWSSPGLAGSKLFMLYNVKFNFISMLDSASLCSNINDPISTNYHNYTYIGSTMNKRNVKVDQSATQIHS